jgi:hypothetical protein
MVIKKVGQVALVLTTLLIANTTLADIDSKEEKPTNFIVTPSVAYRYDVFKWSVPYPQFNKKLSELIWKNHIVEPRIKIEIEPQSNQFTFLGQAKYGYILKHPSKKLDYDWESDSSKPTSKSLSAVRGKIIDLSGAVGYSVGLVKDSLLTFYLGYDYTDYKNKNYGYRQLIFEGETLPLNQLISKYFFKTYSPWVGLSINTPITDRFQVIPTIKYYSFKYVGRGYWLLRDDLKQDPSMKHNAKGAGLGVDVDLLYKYSDNLDFKINLETKKLKMKTGKDQAFYNKNNYGGEKVVNRQLYDLSLMSSSISIGINYKL